MPYLKLVFIEHKYGRISYQHEGNNMKIIIMLIPKFKKQMERKNSQSKTTQTPLPISASSTSLKATKMCDVIKWTSDIACMCTVCINGSVCVLWVRICGEGGRGLGYSDPRKMLSFCFCFPPLLSREDLTTFKMFCLIKLYYIYLFYIHVCKFMAIVAFEILEIFIVLKHDLKEMEEKGKE